MANDLEQKIARQIEYYFGDINLPQDKFLLNAVKTSEGGWVSLDVLLTFKRLANLSKDKEVIAKAVADSNIVEVSEDKLSIRRHSDNPCEELSKDEFEKKFWPKTAYAKGFPKEETLEKLEEFVNKFGKVVSLKQRFYTDKATNTKFSKGSCIIIFETEEDCKKFLEAESVKYNNVELQRMTMEAFTNEKKAELEKRKEKRTKVKVEDEKNGVKEEKPQTVEYTKNIIVKFECEKAPENPDWAQIKAKVLEDTKQTLAHMEHKTGNNFMYGRFNQPEEAEEFLNKLPEKKFTVGGTEYNVSMATEEEQKQFHLNRKQQQQRRKTPYNKSGKKRKAKFSRDSPKAKK